MPNDGYQLIEKMHVTLIGFMRGNKEVRYNIDKWSEQRDNLGKLLEREPKAGAHANPAAQGKAELDIDVFQEQEIRSLKQKVLMSGTCCTQPG